MEVLSGWYVESVFDFKYYNVEIEETIIIMNEL